MQPTPIKAWTRISLASGRNVTVADNGLNRIMAPQVGEQAVEGQVLGILKRQFVTALKFDAERKVIAVLSPHPARDTCMPGAARAGNKLDQFAIAAHKKMGRNLQIPYFTEIGMRSGIQAIGKQLADLRPTKFSGGKLMA